MILQDVPCKVARYGDSSIVAKLGKRVNSKRVDKQQDNRGRGNEN